MDLKQLLNQTTIKTECDTSVDTTDTTDTKIKLKLYLRDLQMV